MTWMRRAVLALVMVGGVAACDRDTPPSNSTDDPPGDSTPPPPQVISGSLRIHTRYGGSDTAATSVYVLLGDGSRFLQRLDASGDVTFEDPSLVGPQDVTLVARYENGYTQAYTYLALERPEVWLPFEPKDSPAPGQQRAYLTGRVTGMSDVRNVVIKAAGRGVWGSGRLTADGSYRIQVEGTLPAVVSLIALEQDPLDPAMSSKPKAVGLKRGIPVPAGQQVSGLDVVIDHPVDQQTQLTINDVQTYQQSFSSAALRFYQDGQYLFDTSKDTFGSYPPRLPSSLPSMALTAPFDMTRAMLVVNVGSSSELTSGAAYARVPVENLSTMTVSLPKPMTLTSPTSLGTSHDPAPVPAPAVPVFQWTMDAATQRVELFVLSDYDNAEKFAWTVTGPGSVTSFKPFSLRLNETATRSPYFFGKYRIGLRSSFDGAIGHYADFFTQQPANDPLAPSWSTSVDGSLDFH